MAPHTGMNALNTVNDYVNQPTQTASPEANIQAVVRRAFRMSKHDLHGLVSNASSVASWRMAAEVATGGEITAEMIVDAARLSEGL